MFEQGQFSLLFTRGAGGRMIQIMPVACRLETPLPRLRVKLRTMLRQTITSTGLQGKVEIVYYHAAYTVWVHSSVQLARLLSCPPSIIEVKRATVPRYVRNTQFHFEELNAIVQCCWCTPVAHFLGGIARSNCCTIP